MLDEECVKLLNRLERPSAPIQEDQKRQTMLQLAQLGGTAFRWYLIGAKNRGNFARPFMTSLSSTFAIFGARSAGPIA